MEQNDIAIEQVKQMDVDAEEITQSPDPETDIERANELDVDYIESLQQPEPVYS